MDNWTICKEYLLLSEQEEAALKSLQPLVAQHVEELVDAFYTHLLAFSETRTLLSDELIATRLRAAQKQYLLSLVTGPYDHQYRQDRLRIGQVHHRIGLTPQWYLGAYALYLNLLHPLIFREYRHRPDQCQLLWIALTKIVFLDLQLAIEAYIQRSSEQLEFANRQLAEMSRQLERGLDQKKRDLLQTQEQLRQTERLAELGTLASSMAHEIGTPLDVILKRAAWCVRQAGEEATKKDLETIVAQVWRIDKIILQLLSFVKQRPFDRRSVDLGKTVESVLEVIQDRLNHNHIRVDLDLGVLVPPVYADPDQLCQVVLNLVLNAIDAMPQGGTLRLAVSQSRDRVRLTVADTGVGIPKEAVAKIFERFFTTKEPGKGTGLGLTVVQGILAEHGGSIEVESEPGQGATFTLHLPLYKNSSA